MSAAEKFVAERNRDLRFRTARTSSGALLRSTQP
jgi:hypothetical protein